jgi:hypothetical protein
MPRTVIVTVSEVRLFTTGGHSVSISWYRAPLWDLRPDITSCRNFAVWSLRSCLCGAPSLTRGRVWNLQCNHSMVLVAQNPKPSHLKLPPTRRARFPYLYPPGTGWPNYNPGNLGTVIVIFLESIPLVKKRPSLLCHPSIRAYLFIREELIISSLQQL